MKRILIFALFVLSACNTISVPDPVPTTGSSVLGLLNVSIDLRDEANPTASAVFSPVGNRSKAQSRAITGINDSIITIKRRQVEFLDDNDISPLFGTQTRYVQATFEIANTGATAFNNLNFIGTSFPTSGSNPGAGTSWTATKLGTMFTALTTGSGAAIAETATFPDSSNIYRRIKPTHGMRPALRGVAVNPDLADLQVFTRTGNVATGEIDKLIADIIPFYPTAEPLDFGYVAHNFSGQRTIPTTAPGCALATDASCYKGQVTLGFVMPRQPTRLNTPYTFGFQLVVAEESSTIATQSLEEQTDARGSGRIQALLQTLPNINPMINLLTGSGFYGASTLNKRTLCDVRTAQASLLTTPSFVSPELLITGAGVKMETVAPAPNSMFAPTTSAITATYCQAMNAPSDTNLVIQGFQTGQRKTANIFYTGSFTPNIGSSDTLGYLPSAAFKPGEEVEVSLSSSITRASDTAAIKPVVYRFRTATSPEALAGFGAATNLVAGTLPLAVVTGDFNKDGTLDLASANQTSNTVSVLIGIPAGGFNPAVSVAVGTAPSEITIGDLNNDGSLDLATANTTASTISVLIGNGTGGFTAAVNYAVNSNPNSIALGDFNSDGSLDLVTTSDNAAGTVSMLLGTGAGVFGTATSFRAGNNQDDVVTGDFNADGHLDLAVVLNRPSDPGLISILLGNGFGNFLTPVLHSTVGFNPTTIATGDFNNDGRLDLVTANNDTSAPISVLLSNSAGEYATVLELQLTGIPTSITTGDINGDGRLDIIAVTDDPTNNVSVLAGNGTGGFATAVNYTAGTNPAGVTTGDFNNDGRLDLVVANPGSNSLNVRLKQ